jgi:hypothetical protein
MRPASFLTARVQLEDISKTLQGLQQEPAKPSKPEPRVTLSFFKDYWPQLGVILVLGAIVVAFGWLAWPRGPSASPRAALVSLGAPFQPKKVQVGESFWGQMPDGRWIVATAMGWTKSWEELPWTGNRIGDARWIGKHCYVWLNPIGQTSPTWIDP